MSSDVLCGEAYRVVVRVGNGWPLTLEAEVTGRASRAFTPLASSQILNSSRHNLPAQLTPLVGRITDISAVCEVFIEERLVTLTGSAGVGKTRLALAVAAEMLDRYPGRVWWVELAAVSDPPAVGRAALLAVGGREARGRSIAQQLGVELGADTAMIVLDNCEHLLSPCAELVTELLIANPATLVLTTSREPLGVPGEITWRVPSLTFPQTVRLVEVDALLEYDAVELFVDRARRARPSFAVTEDNASAIAQICSRLDGIPLALEMAAARCRQLSVEHIAQELHDRFRLLTGGARTAVARQRTLEASIGWSHALLDEREKIVFRRLGVFAGAFPLEAAEAVVTGLSSDVAANEIFAILICLVDKSLVVASEGAGGQPRYRLLESMRAYAVDQARAAGELSGLCAAHASWWTQWLEPSFGMPTDGSLDLANEFHDNLKAALDWAVNEPRLGLRLLRVLSRVWAQLGCEGDAITAAEQLLDEVNAEQHPSEWLAAALPATELFDTMRGPNEWRTLRAKIEEIALANDDAYALAHIHFDVTQHDAVVRFYNLARDRGDQYMAARTAIALATELAENDPTAAEQDLAQAQGLAAASGNRSLRTKMIVAEAMAARCTGDLRRCITLGRQLVESEVGTGVMEVLSPLSFAGLLARDEDTLRMATAASERIQRRTPGLALWAEIPKHRLELLEGRRSEGDRFEPFEEAQTVVTLFGTLWLDCREAIDAGNIALAGTVRKLGRPVPHGQAVQAAVEGAVTNDASRWYEALALAVNHNLRLIAVDALEGLGVAYTRSDRSAAGLRLLAAAERLRDETGYRWRFAFEQRAIDDALAAGRNAIGDDAAVIAEAEGRDLDWRGAADYALRARGTRRRPHHGWASLTPTELQVASLIAAGLSNPEIASRLFVSRSTVKTHLEHIFSKLGVKSRTAVAAEASHHSTR